MAMKIILIFVSCGAVLQEVYAQSGACDQQLNNFRTCVRNQMQSSNNDPTANENKRSQIENDFRRCCTSGGCSDPFPNSIERQARIDCFNQARNTIRSQIEQCVRSQSRRNDFRLPLDDSDKDAYWRFEMLRVFAAMKNIGDNRYNKNQRNKQNWNKVSPNQPANDVCGNDDNKKQRVAQCVQSKGIFNNTAANSSWRKGTCRIKSQCGQQVSTQCQSDWDNKFSPALCDCVSQAQSNNKLSQIQSQYTQCLRSKSVRLQNEQNDEGRQVVAKMYSDWCAQGKKSSSQNQKNQCQRRGSGQSGNNQNGQWNGNNQNGQWNGNNQNGQWNGNNQNGQNPNTWNNQNGNQNWNTDPNNGGYDDGSSYSNTDSGGLFSGMLGGGTDPFSSLTGGSSGGLLSSFTGGSSPLGGLGSGGLLSSFGGGGGNLLGGGLGSGLGGGLLGGGGSPLDAASSLGALGGGGDLLSSFGGGMDASNLLGGLGSFGKKK